MSLDEGLSKFLGELYEAVYDPDRWRSALTEVIRRSGSQMIMVGSVDLREQQLAGVQFHGSEHSSFETGVREYAEGMSALDPSLNWAHNHPAAGICETTAIVPEHEYDDHEFIKWTKSRFRTRQWRVFYPANRGSLSFGVSFHASPNEGSPSRELLPLQALLFENLERAVRLAARPPNFAADDTALIAADATGRPLSLSRRAEELIQAGDGLVIVEGVLAAQESNANHLLRRAFRAAIDPTFSLPGRAVRIRRNSGKHDLLVVVSRFPPSLDHIPGPTPAALVRIVELEQRPEHLSEHSHLFDLTRRETEVASALLEGHSIDSMSAALGMSRNTARNHVQALFEKTRTNRQADLIRMLDRLARQ